MRVFTVDAFTDKPFRGNPAGVCILDNPLPENMYREIAREINLSETAFVIKKGNDFSIRWFTPTVEVNLCGHATLSAAQVLYSLGFCDPSNTICFESKSGQLTAKKIGDKIELNFPQLFVQEVDHNDVIEKAFDIKPIYVGRDNNRYLIEIESYEKLLSIKPDFQLLQSDDLGKFIITVKSELEGYDFISRFFAPAVGVLEDPVTGSSHCYLAPYWSRKLNKNIMVGLQASERSGYIECELVENNRLLMRSKAIIMSELIPIGMKI